MLKTKKVITVSKIRKASASKITQWITTARKQVSATIVEKLFQKCCVTNALDSSENDLMLEEADYDLLSSSSENSDNPDNPSRDK